MFSFWVNGIFANKQVLFDNCVLMQPFKRNCQRVQAVHSYQKST